MRKETTILLCLLLLATAPQGGAQETVSEEDLNSVLEETPSTTSEVSEVIENSSAPAASDTTNISGDTVTLDPLPTSPETPSEQPTEATTPAPTETTETTVETPTPAPTESVTTETPPATTTPADDLESFKADVGDDELKPLEGTEPPKTETAKKDVAPEQPKISEPAVFDVGREERELLSMAQNIQGQITDGEWNEVATAAKAESYTVIKNDWLFKISKRFFGTGFYYPKIWSLNSYITNPHFIEPGMVLSFTTGSAKGAPEVKVGTFTKEELEAAPGSIGNLNKDDLSNFGEDAVPNWVNEKTDLEKQGIYFQYASEETMDDLSKVSEQALNREYEHYEPPKSDFEVILPKNYDKSGFDKNSRIFYSYKEGFYLSTFLSTNIVQDFGSITNGPDENIFFVTGDRAYLQFDETINVLPGDQYSIYSSGGKVSQKNSDREGYKYTVIGHVKVIRKIRDKWEVEFTKVVGTPQRGDRITAHTPQIDRIMRTFNSRMVEAAIMSGFQPRQTILGYGDVVYLDRGRADGVELGNVFEVYGFKDRLTKKEITDQPTYKTGELTVITLTDNFATALVTATKRDFYPGDIAITKTKEAHLREKKAKDAMGRGEADILGGKALEELDVELNLENVNDDLLKQADKIQLTEDELAELERQEREKSVIKDSERDLKALERLEKEIDDAQTILNDAKLDEDKLLEDQNINELEKKQSVDGESLDEIEENLGRRYMDEDLNSKDNPFGLTEFDVEEVDELLNTEKKANP